MIRIGISGWRYAPWRGEFYPEGLPQREELSYAASKLGTIEINGTFYSLQRPESFALWYAQTPADFVFAVKGARYITHTLRLREPEVPLANFMAQGIFNLREKLGPLLWQLPPSFKFNKDRLARFLDVLPHDTAAAARLARKRHARMKGRARLAIDRQRPLRHAVEVRHPSFAEPAFLDLLRERNIALVIAESARKWPMFLDLTADFIYMRLHGDQELYRSGYGEKALNRWARRMRAWRRRSDPDMYCYFDNTDVKLRAPRDAQSLMRKLSLRPSTL